MSGRFILAGLVALVLATFFVVIPHAQQGWEKRHATMAEFDGTDRSCTAAQIREYIPVENRKTLHDACMKNAGWKPLQTWQ